jgi:hypothetical protein
MDRPYPAHEVFYRDNPPPYSDEGEMEMLEDSPSVFQYVQTISAVTSIEAMLTLLD